MYKQLLKSLINDIQKKEKMINDLHKQQPIFQQPHFIFSADKPLHERKLNMDHDKIMTILQGKGYNPIEISGKYGSEERSILIPNPNKKNIKYLKKLAGALGQESSIYSTGYNHEMHFHNGENKGRFLKGQGTTIHKQPPEDFYSKLPTGETFTHTFNFDNYNPIEQSIINLQDKKINKSESFNGFFLTKNEEEDHPLLSANRDTKLIHYSPKEGLKNLDPKHHGARRIGAEVKRGVPDHKMSFYYLEGTKPEDIVMTGTKSKYVAKLGDRKLYDVGKDPNGIYKKLREQASNRQVNPGSVRVEEYHQALKDNGYKGIYNSSLNETMRNVVGMFEHADIEAEYPIHPLDYQKASSFDHYSLRDTEKRSQDKEYAKEQGHTNPKFFNKLRTIFSRKKK